MRPQKSLRSHLHEYEVKWGSSLSGLGSTIDSLASKDNIKYISEQQWNGIRSILGQLLKIKKSINDGKKGSSDVIMVSANKKEVNGFVNGRKVYGIYTDIDNPFISTATAPGGTIEESRTVIACMSQVLVEADSCISVNRLMRKNHGQESVVTAYRTRAKKHNPNGSRILSAIGDIADELASKEIVELISERNWMEINSIYDRLLRIQRCAINYQPESSDFIETNANKVEVEGFVNGRKVYGIYIHGEIPTVSTALAPGGTIDESRVAIECMNRVLVETDSIFSRNHKLNLTIIKNQIR